MNSLSHDQRVDALSRLEKANEYPQAKIRLKAIDRLLVLPEDFSQSDLRPILGKREHPLQIERALKLYVMMGRVMKLCEPKGLTTGPACAVRQIKFEELTQAEALDLKNGIGFRLALQVRDSNGSSPFCGLDLLNSEEKELYKRLKPYFAARAKPTLKVLAARLLRDSEDRTFSDRAVIRYIDALKDYAFVHPNHRRDYLISSVNSYGAHNKSANESVRYAMAQAVVEIGPRIREQILPIMAQTAQFAAQTVPRIPEFIEQANQAIAAMRVTLPAFRDTLPLMAQSVAQIPIVLPQLQQAVADVYRSVPQTLSLLGKLNLNVRQN